MSGIQLFPRGGLDLDSDLQYVANGDQTNNRNTRSITKTGQTSGSKEIIVGNQHAYDLGGIGAAQDKTMRLHTNNVVGTVFTVTFYDQNNRLIATATYTVVFGNTVANVNTNFGAAITAALNAATPSWANNQTPIDNGDGTGYLDMQIFQGIGNNVTFTYSGESEIMQEAWTTDLIGRFQVIASEEFLGNLFIFSSPVTELPTTVDLVDVAGGGGAAIVVTTVTPHGMSTGDLVLLSGTQATNLQGNSVDGYYTVTVTSATVFELDGQEAGVGSTQLGTATMYSTGMGEIGVATFDENTDVWTYTRLIRSREFNWRIQHQHDRPKITFDNGKFSIYYTDNYNAPGVFYYYGEFYNDGAIQNLNPQTNTGDRGIYEYDSIADEVRLQQNVNTARLDFPYSATSQDATGGALPSGSYRYTFRLLSESLAATPYASLSNPVPVYTVNQFGPAFNILAPSVVGEITPKTNYLTVSNIDTDLFKYVELVALYYPTAESVQGFTVSRTPITGSTMVLPHSGNETTSAFLDLNELLAVQPSIATAKSNLILENRYLLGNVTLATQYDLTPWTTTFTHALTAAALNDVGDIDNYLYGEFQKPENVYSSTGYMLLEQYRFGCVVYYKNGLISEPFYIDDIDFTTSATNVVTTANQPYGNRRTAGLTDYALTGTTASPNRSVYQFFVEFSNIDFNYQLPDGKLIKDVVDHIEIWRREVIPEVLVTGMVFPSFITGGRYFPQPDWSNLAVAPAAGTYSAPIGDARRAIGFMVAPDALYGQNAISFQSGDQVYMFGQPNIPNTTQYGASLTTFSDLRGDYFSSPVLPFKTIEALQTVGTLGQSGGITTTATGAVTYDLEPGFAPAVYFEASYVIGLGATANDYFQNILANDPGIYYCAIYRRNTNKYGAATSGTYIPTGHRYDISSTSPAILGNTAVLGGDVYTQKSWMKLTYWASGAGISGAGIGYYSQNRVNVQMHYNTSDPGYVWPEAFGSVTPPNTETWLETTYPARDKFLFDTTYIPGNLVNNTKVYDPSLIRAYNFPARIYYSGVKPEGGVQDSFRIIPAFNFYDCDANFGELMHLSDIAGSLITFQRDVVVRQYFNSSGNLQTTNSGQEIVVGGSGVFPRRGTTVSNTGTKHKFSIVEGITKNGHPFVTWISTDYKDLMKYDPYTGARAISVPGFRSFLLNNLTYVQDYDKPAWGLGIHGVSNQRYSEIIYTVRGEVTSVEWETGETYPIGTRVHLATQTAGTTTTFEGFTEIYTAQFAVLSSNLNKPETAGGAEIWVKSTEYNRYTFVYSEQVNKVICFVTFRPKIYLKYLDGFLSPFPTTISDDTPARIYEHDKGVYAEWYKTSTFGTPNPMNFTQGSATVTTSAGFTATFPHPEAFVYVIEYLGVDYIVQSVTNNTTLVLESVCTGTSGATSSYYIINSEDGEVEMVCNALPNVSKNFTALQYATEITPHYVDLATTSHESFLEETDFEEREGYWVAPIKMDTNGTTSNDGDTSRLFGRFVKVNLHLQRRVYQKLFDFIVSFRDNFRKP